MEKRKLTVGQDADEPMACDWVVGSFKGKQADSVLAHAHTAGSYIIIDKGKEGRDRTVTAAFLRPRSGEALPHHLLPVIDPKEQAKFNRIRNAVS